MEAVEPAEMTASPASSQEEDNEEEEEERTAEELREEKEEGAGAARRETSRANSIKLEANINLPQLFRLLPRLLSTPARRGRADRHCNTYSRYSLNLYPLSLHSTTTSNKLNTNSSLCNNRDSQLGGSTSSSEVRETRMEGGTRPSSLPRQWIKAGRP